MPTKAALHLVLLGATTNLLHLLTTWLTPAAPQFQQPEHDLRAPRQGVGQEQGVCPPQTTGDIIRQRRRAARPPLTGGPPLGSLVGQMPSMIPRNCIHSFGCRPLPPNNLRGASVWPHLAGRGRQAPVRGKEPQSPWQAPQGGGPLAVGGDVLAQLGPTQAGWRFLQGNPSCSSGSPARAKLAPLVNWFPISFWQPCAAQKQEGLRRLCCATEGSAKVDTREGREEEGGGCAVRLPSRRTPRDCTGVW